MCFFFTLIFRNLICFQLGMSGSKLSFISENGAKSRVTFGNMIFALILIEIE